MKALAIAYLFLLLATQLTAQQYFQWSTKAGGVADDYVNSIVCPSNNKIYVAGGFVDTIYSDKKEASGYGMRDIFLACYNDKGKTEWIKTLGGLKADNVTRLAIGKKCVYMAGVIKDDVKQNKKSFSGNNQSLFVASWSLNGKINWLKRFDYEGVITSDVLEVSPEGIIHTGGMIQGKINIEGKELGYNDKKRAYLLALTEKGEPVKSELSNGSGNHRLVSAYFDNKNNGYYLFSTTGSFSIEGSIEEYNAVNWKGGLILIKAKSINKPDWVKLLQNNSYSEGVRVIGSAENIYVCVNFRKSLTTSDTILSTDSRQAVAVLCFNNDGDPLWEEVIHGSSNCRAMDAMCNMAGNAVVTGYYNIGYKVGPTEVNTENPEGSIFLIQFDEKGKIIWHNEPGDNAPNFSKSFTLSHDGDILLAGGFRGELELEGQKLNSAGSIDIFIAKYFNCGQLETKISDPGPLCNGGELELIASGSFSTYLWNNSEWGDTYSVQQPGTYFVTSYNKFGCAATDTIVIVEASSGHLGLPEIIEINPGAEELLKANGQHVVYNWSDGVTGSSRSVMYNPLTDSLQLILTATTNQDCILKDSTLVIFNSDKNGQKMIADKGLSIYPNPVQDDLHWSFKNRQDKITVTLTNGSGEYIYKEQLSNYLPNSFQTIDMRKFASGTYLLSLSLSTETLTQKIVKR